jgi:two-component system phosphate regulon sensor histidine kinase PhoR
VLDGRSGNREPGVLVVLGEVTRLKRLERMRRDFAANVSHELRTPVTTIKGCAETLLDGSLEELPEARRFLDAIRRQADRLAAIIEDLLRLSLVEQEDEKGGIELAQESVADILNTALQDHAGQASEKNIRILVACPTGLQARASRPLLAQAVSNLLDNAIKYSEPGGTVSLAAERLDQEVVIRVADQGVGIEKEHLTRLFERFYRVDKARSRKLGGTGLGLSIVKHIALAHGGRVSVESTPGKGSAFKIHLPDPGDRPPASGGR